MLTFDTSSQCTACSLGFWSSLLTGMKKNTKSPSGPVACVLCVAVFCVVKWDFVKWVVSFSDWWDLHCHNPPTLFASWQWEKQTQLPVACPSELTTDDDSSAHVASLTHIVLDAHIHKFYIGCYSAVKLMLRFNIPSLWKAEDLFNLHQQQGSWIPLFTSSHTHTHTIQKSGHSRKPLHTTATAIESQLWKLLKCNNFNVLDHKERSAGFTVSGKIIHKRCFAKVI